MKKIKNSVLLIFIILIAIVLALVVAGFIAFYFNLENNGKIASGVFLLSMLIVCIFLCVAHIDCKNFKRKSALGKIWLSSTKKRHI